MISWIQPARFSGGGGGGGGGIALVGADSLATLYSTNSGTTSNFSVGGTNPIIIGSIVGREPSSPSPVLSVCKYGGSSGTDLTLMTSSDREFASTSARAGRYLIAPGPSGTSNIYATFSSASLGTIIQGCAFSGVNQTTPYDNVATNAGNTTGTSATLSVTIGSGLSTGDICLAHFTTIFENNNGQAFNNTGITANEIITQPSAGESRTWVGGIWVMQVATGSSCTLQINATQSASEIFNWDAYAFRLVPA